MNKEDKMQEKKTVIMERALEIFSQKGYINTPVRDIIDASGYGTSTFYRYFSGKEAVLKALLNDFLIEIMGRVKSYYESESDLMARFIETKRGVLEAFIGNRGLSALYARIPGVSDEIDACLKEFDDRYMAQVCANIRYGIGKGVFRDAPVEPIAHGVLGVIKYAVYRWIVLEDLSETQMIDLVVSFHESLAMGLLPEGRRA